MDTQVGQTISADQFNQAYPVGTTLSAEEFASKYEQTPKPQGYQESQPFTRAIGNSPLGKIFDIPVLGGILRNAASSTEAYGRMLGGGFIQSPLLALSGGKVNIPFLDEQGLERFSKNPIGEGLGTTLNAMGTAASFYNPLATVKSIPGILKAPFHPIEALGKLRGLILKNKSVPTTQMEADTAKNLLSSRYFQNAPALAQREAKGILSKFQGNLNPMLGGEGGFGQIAKQPQTLLNEIYKNLTPLEKTYKAYGKGTDLPSAAMSQGANFVSHAIRDYLKNQSPLSAKLLTSLMNGLYKTPGAAKWVGGGAAATGAGAYLLKQLFSGGNYNNR